jgi:Flp pilus assembly secretin CpaC
MLTKTEKAAIPYAEELTYPENWAEIDAKRDQEQQGAFDEPENKQVYEQLSKTVDLSMFRPEMPFSEAINILEESVSPSLTIIPMWVDLEQNAEVYRSTPINMSAISSIPLQTGLKLLLESVSTGFAELDYVVESGIIKVATEGSLDVKLQTRTYDVTLLLGQPADFHAGVGDEGGGSRGGRQGQSGGSSGEGEYYSEYFEDETESMSREERQQQKENRKERLITTIQETVAPSSWFDAGGEGTITSYEDKKLIIRQTRDIHKDIKNLLDEMQRTLGEQVGIEARFLVVGENFLEDIGLDLDFRIGKAEQYNTSNWQPFNVDQTSYDSTNPSGSGVSGSLSDVVAATATGGYGSALDDLEVNFLIRATQAHQNAKTLSTGNVTVLSGEAAVFRTRETIRFIEPPDVGSTDISYGGGGGTSQQDIETDISEVPVGTTLNVTPTITPDKKHVLLNVFVEKTTFKGFEEQDVQIPNLSGNEAISYKVTNIPQTQISRVRTRVSVPDGATLLLGGQKVTSETEAETGVPVLSKMPVVGRLFSNRSKIKDQKNLLILVKPTIILQEERDKEALTVGDSDY